MRLEIYLVEITMPRFKVTPTRAEITAAKPRPSLRQYATVGAVHSKSNKKAHPYASAAAARNALVDDDDELESEEQPTKTKLKTASTKSKTKTTKKAATKKKRKSKHVDDDDDDENSSTDEQHPKRASKRAKAAAAAALPARQKSQRSTKYNLGFEGDDSGADRRDDSDY